MICVAAACASTETPDLSAQVDPNLPGVQGSGDPSRRIGDMRHTVWVMSDGALMNADELREAAGFSGRPK